MSAAQHGKAGGDLLKLHCQPQATCQTLRSLASSLHPQLGQTRQQGAQLQLQACPQLQPARPAAVQGPPAGLQTCSGPRGRHTAARQAPAQPPGQLQAG